MNAQTTFVPGYNYDIPHTQWLGKDWNSDIWWGPFEWNYREIIANNFGRLRKVFSDDPPSGEYIYWYCWDYANQCAPGTVAYSWSTTWISLWRNHYTVFCNIALKFETLSKQIGRAAWSIDQQRIMENFQTNAGQVMFHEIWHYTMVSQPRTDDYAYRAEEVWDLALKQGTDYSYVNADSYALDAIAIYVQQYFSNSMSPVPRRVYRPPDDTVDGNVTSPVNATGVVLEEAPWQSWQPGIDMPVLKPDPDFWNEAIQPGGISALGADLHIVTDIYPIQTRCEDTDFFPITSIYPTPTASTEVIGATGTQCFCTCGLGSMADLIWATNGPTLTNWCAGVSTVVPVPSGFTITAKTDCS
ncbi:uncharacterized protein LY89DRAFT_293192 [Mollisia scopiformis]|uniref:Putative peptidase domain-containing protein n=1 Tax=Mollisia scopiformis TaxID=149040 RepID=A0A194XRE7_MOLSC|nr:uncharacterized protein LY89DRAFT_293192 [Mollisia scopiformis]KUJ22302.1 hypothetical protein LY89DRAFT_293192 [Mollisia scopiformis]